MNKSRTLTVDEIMNLGLEYENLKMCFTRRHITGKDESGFYLKVFEKVPFKNCIFNESYETIEELKKGIEYYMEFFRKECGEE